MSALIEFEEVCKYYQMGDTTVKAADHITMKIDKGEFVSIVGQSGSGKSTCMNIIGCLDVPTHGVYRLNGRDVGKMSRNELASVRNEMLGFIFQQYNLLPRLNLMENVEVPLVYAGVSRAERHARAREVLEQVGLGDKLKNRPNQLSGGQQQRVSIARALVRNPPVILADEPTGALDSHTGREVLGLLQQLHKQGHTVVLITHDNSIAVQADRIIRLEDGRVVYGGDSRTGGHGAAHSAARNAGKGGTGMIFETFRQAIQNVWSNKLRTFLTMLGIIIGVMAVIVIVGLGNGMTKSMRDSFSALGTNTLSIQVWGYGSRTVPVDDMYDICQRHSDLIKAVSPQIEFSGNASGTLKIGTTSYRWSNISGVDENYTEMKNYQIAQGRGLQYMDMQDNKQVCIIGDYLNRVAFGGNGVGQTLKIGANKFRIVGVLAAKVSNPTMQQGSDDDCVYLPYTTVMRLSSQSAVNNYTAVMTDENFANEAKTTMEEELQKILKTENGYYVYSASEWLEEMNKMINMVIVVLTGIASISLLVGGIGIMNIMLVSVTERTREIGIRKALGAKERTILAQFVVEAATTSALGGALGIALGYAVSMAANKVLPMFMSDTAITVSPSFNSIVVAFGISVGIGVLFGYLPARRAARLNPIEALRYD